MTLPPVPRLVRLCDDDGSLRLGDKVEAVAKVFGVRGCRGCGQRKEALNRITLHDPLDAAVERAMKDKG